MFYVRQGDFVTDHWYLCCPTKLRYLSSFVFVSTYFEMLFFFLFCFDFVMYVILLRLNVVGTSLVNELKDSLILMTPPPTLHTK